MSDPEFVDYKTDLYRGELSPVVKKKAKQKEDSGSDEKMPWHQQSKETSQAFAAFRIYIDMGPGRNQKKLSHILYGIEDEVAQQVKKWSVDNDWVNRAEAWDRFVSHSHLANMEAAVREAEQTGLRFMPRVVTNLAHVAIGEKDVTRTQMRAMTDFLDRFGPAKQRSIQPTTVKNYNVTFPSLPEEQTKNLLNTEEAEFEDITDQAKSLIPEELKR